MRLGNKTTNPGELRTKVTLQTRAAAADAGGFMTATWTNVATAWCRWQNAHGREVLQAQMGQVEAPATVLLRHRNDIDITCALLKDGVRYEIVSMDNIGERNEYVELKVVRMKAG